MAKLDISRIFNYPDVTYLQREKIKSAILTEDKAGEMATAHSHWHGVVGDPSARGAIISSFHTLACVSPLTSETQWRRGGRCGK